MEERESGVGTPTGGRARILGVVGNVRNAGLGATPRPQMFMPAAVAPIDPMRFVIRSRLSIGTLVPEIRRAVARVNPLQPVYGFETMRQIMLGQ